MFGKLVRALDRVFFRPETLHPDVISGLAMAPSLIAGVILFRVPAIEFLTIALAVGAAIHLIARVLRLSVAMSPVLPAVMGVALCGPLASPLWPLLVAMLAGVLEVLRGHFWPSTRVANGVVAYALLFLAGGGAMAAYVRPGSTVLFPEPIQQWSRFFGGSTHFIEPITLYVGNVAGPVFATSLLAVAVGLAWLWYARRLSVGAAIAFLVAGVAISAALRWDPVFQMDSGPAWFCAGLALCDRRLLPPETFARPVLAAMVGALGVGLRAVHLYIEALFIAVAAVQVVFTLVELGVRMVAPRVARIPFLARRGPASA